MLNNDDWQFFRENGYVIIKNVLDKKLLDVIGKSFDEIRAAEGGDHCNQHILLKYKAMIDLIEH